MSTTKRRALGAPLCHAPPGLASPRLWGVQVLGSIGVIRTKSNSAGNHRMWTRPLYYAGSMACTFKWLRLFPELIRFHCAWEGNMLFYSMGKNDLLTINGNTCSSLHYELFELVKLGPWATVHKCRKTATVQTFPILGKAPTQKPHAQMTYASMLNSAIDSATNLVS